jgi:hypothetical protein
MTFRFEEEGYKNLYVLEDYYCTNPFCDCNHVTVAFLDRENKDNQISFLLNFNKTLGILPDHEKLSPAHEIIVNNFIKNMQDELLVLFKQRYFEAKAFGEKNPKSYLVFEPNRYVNYMELFPRNKGTLNFSHEDDKYFAEDLYDLDSRADNRDVQLTFYKLDPSQEKSPSIFNYTYYLDESKREEEDNKLENEFREVFMAFNQFIPNLYDVLKKRYKEAKAVGDELRNASSQPKVGVHKVARNEMCPCGSGKKYKKCCALKVN